MYRINRINGVWRVIGINEIGLTYVFQYESIMEALEGIKRLTA
ncbi:MAG: hypothetical protein WCO07_01455 [bacterium]